MNLIGEEDVAWRCDVVGFDLIIRLRSHELEGGSRGEVGQGGR